MLGGTNVLKSNWKDPDLVGEASHLSVSLRSILCKRCEHMLASCYAFLVATGDFGMKIAEAFPQTVRALIIWPNG